MIAEADTTTNRCRYFVNGTPWKQGVFGILDGMHNVIGKITVGFVLFILLLFVVAGYGIFRWYTAFQSADGPKWSEVVAMVKRGWKAEPLSSSDVKTVLILGVDSINGRPIGKNNTAILTDSMMVVSFNLKTHTIIQFSLPRDLWIDAYKTKVNALYHYGFDRNPENPTIFPRDVLQNVLGIPIHHVMVLNLSTVAEIIDALGGLDITVDRTFTDDRFPRQGVDITTVRDPAVLYETVRFEKGVEHMNGERALKYIRSRHSTDLLEGTDEARVVRQQKVFQSLLSAITNTRMIMYPKTLGKAYAVYVREFQQVFPVEEVIAVLRTVLQSTVRNGTFVPKITLIRRSISIKENGKSGVLYHPINGKLSSVYGGQWVYLPIDPTWNALQKEIQEFEKTQKTD